MQDFLQGGNEVWSNDYAYLRQKVRDENFGLFSDLSYIVEHTSDKCDLTYIGLRNIQPQPYSVGLQKGSAYARDVDKV